MLAFLWSAGREGFDTHASDMAVWDWGIRPWPTMDNLAAKGLIEAESWGGREEGWTWRLTPDGMDYMRKVAAERGR